MESEKITAFWHKKQYGNIVIKFEKGPIVGYVNCLNDGKYQFIITPEFKFNKNLFSHILAKFSIILTESINLQDSFNKYLYKCVTTNDIPTNITTILSSLNKKGSILTNFVESLKPYNLFIGTLLQKENGFKINYEVISAYCMKHDLLTKDEAPHILHFFRLLFETFDCSDFEKMKIQEPEVEVEEHEVEEPEVDEPEVEVEVEEHEVEEPKVDEPEVEVDEVEVEVEGYKVEVDESEVEEHEFEEPEVEEPEIEVDETKVKVETREPQTQIQLTDYECKLLIFISETTGNSWASFIIGNSIQYANKTQQLIQAINLIQKILVHYNQKDFNVTRVVFNKFY